MAHKCPEKRREYARKYYEKNKETIKRRAQKHYEENREAKKAYQKGYYEENRESQLEYHRNYYEENLEAKKAYYRGYYEKNREAKKAYYEENREGILEARRKYRAKNREKLMVSAAKRRAEQEGLPFNLTPEDINIPEACPVLGINLENGRGSSGDPSPTLDRIVPEKGYVKGNVQVISHRANRLKSDASVEELEAILKYTRGQEIL